MVANLKDGDLTIYDVLRYLVERCPSTSEKELMRLTEAIHIGEENKIFSTEGMMKL